MVGEEEEEGIRTSPSTRQPTKCFGAHGLLSTPLDAELHLHPLLSLLLIPAAGTGMVAKLGGSGPCASTHMACCI